MKLPERRSCYCQYFNGDNLILAIVNIVMVTIWYFDPLQVLPEIITRALLGLRRLNGGWRSKFYQYKKDDEAIYADWWNKWNTVKVTARLLFVASVMIETLYQCRKPTTLYSTAEAYTLQKLTSLLVLVSLPIIRTGTSTWAVAGWRNSCWSSPALLLAGIQEVTEAYVLQKLTYCGSLLHLYLLAFL